MPDYKKMYLHMVHESERAMDILIEAQLECERMEAAGLETPLTPLEKKEEDELY